MDPNVRELVQKLYVLMTEILEDALESAIAGQSPTLSTKQSIDAARKLQEAAREISALAEAIMIVARRPRA